MATTTTTKSFQSNKTKHVSTENPFPNKRLRIRSSQNPPISPHISQLHSFIQKCQEFFNSRPDLAIKISDIAFHDNPMPDALQKGLVESEMILRKYLAAYNNNYQESCQTPNELNMKPAMILKRIIELVLNINPDQMDILKKHMHVTSGTQTSIDVLSDFKRYLTNTRPEELKEMKIKFDILGDIANPELIISDFLKYPLDDLLKFRHRFISCEEGEGALDFPAIIKLGNKFSPEDFSTLHDFAHKLNLILSQQKRDMMAKAAAAQANAVVPVRNSTPNTTTGGLGLHINDLPVIQVVYNHIVKPYPKLRLLWGSGDNTKELYVEVSLIKRSDGQDVSYLIDGTRKTLITEEKLAIFNKLKIKQTSRQSDSDYLLHFHLVRHEANEFYPIPSTTIKSNVVDVVSHSKYIKNKVDTRVDEITPEEISLEMYPSGPGKDPGVRIVILGSGFIHSNALRVKIGDEILFPEFHESETLICTIPLQQLQRKVGDKMTVSVSNDGIEYCNSTVVLSISK